MEPYLTPETGRAILNRILKLVGDPEVLRQNLLDQGFHAIDGVHQFIDHISVSEEEYEKRVGQFRDNCIYTFTRSSIVLVETTERRNLAEIQRQKGPRPDPLLRTRPVSFDTTYEIFDWRRARFDRELLLQQNSLSMYQDFPHSERGLRRLFLSLAQECGGPLGLLYDKSRSHKKQMALYCPITENWDLRWYIDNTHDWGNSRHMVSKPGRHMRYIFRCEIALVSRQIPLPIEQEMYRGQIMEIRYTQLLPGFWDAYVSFDDPKGLELCVRTHFALLELVFPSIKSVVSGYV